MKRFLRAFDEEYETADGVKGGDLKKGFLLGRDIPRTVKFDRRTQLDTLIRELTKAFTARYEEPTSAEQISELQRLRDKGFIDDDQGNDSVVLKASLKSPDWLVDTFRRHLNAGSWLSSDKAHLGQPIGSGSERAREQGQPEPRIPPAKNQRFSDGSGSYSSGSRVASDDEQSD